MKNHRLLVFFEFLVFGVTMGLAEDLIAVTVATGQPITWHVFVIVLCVAIPFAIAGEFLFDKFRPSKKR